MDRARAYADAHGIPVAYDSYEALCDDPNIDIVYIASKTWHHHRDLMMAIAAGKHVLCEKPFTDTANQAKEAYAAAEEAGVFCGEGMWTRYFPAIEHARAALERGDIGELQVVQNDYPDPVYALNPVVAGFGIGEFPVIAASGRKPQLRDEAVAKSGKGGSFAGYSPGLPTAAVLQYTGQQGLGVITLPTGRFKEEALFVGTNGRITVESPSHHPVALTIATGRPPRNGSRVAEGRPEMEYTPGGGWVGDWRPTHWDRGHNPSSGAFANVERFEYPVPTPRRSTRANRRGHAGPVKNSSPTRVGRGVTETSTDSSTRRGPSTAAWPAGLKETPQFTTAESIHVCEIIDEIKRQCAERGSEGSTFTGSVKMLARILPGPFTTGSWRLIGLAFP